MREITDAEKEILTNEIVSLKAENLVLKTQIDRYQKALDEASSAVKEFIEKVNKRNHDE